MAKKKASSNDSDKNIHDKFFKEIFSRKEIMVDFIQEIFPEILRNNLNVSTLQLENNSFTGEELDEYFSDLIYSCEYAGKKTIRISLLLEHKSYVEDFPHFQLNQYLLNIWKEDLKQKQQPTLTIPIVIYHGSRKWKKRPVASYFDETDEILENYIPSFDYLLFDISHFSDEQIRNFKNRFFALSTVLLKYSRTKRYFEQIAEDFAEILSVILEYETNDIAIPLFHYLSNTSDATRKEMNDVFNRISPQNENKAMTLYSRLFNEGRQEGIQEGMQEGAKNEFEKGIIRLKEYGMDDATIATINKISIERVRAILVSHKK